MKTPLADQPSMDDLKIGPAGQTFGQLKAAVLSGRAATMRMLLSAEPDASVMEAYNDAVSLLKAAYVRVGLPYEAP